MTEPAALRFRPLVAADQDRSGTGLASVDEHAPQLGIALPPTSEHRGHGGPRMREALAAAWRAGFAQVALTVHPQNPARALYRRCGFVDRDLRRGYHLMVAPRA